ncbi:hypothetical protein AB0I10_40640, partial [Streptomyces sp. NPDC050636]|uniref:hypothetical protein n=1 Tax=Streptomyces sp. NPDC050636 TaxID=3154510 RepID=UPI0034181ED2
MQMRPRRRRRVAGSGPAARQGLPDAQSSVGTQPCSRGQSTIEAVSVFKPQGRTPYGLRKQREAR